MKTNRSDVYCVCGHKKEHHWQKIKNVCDRTDCLMLGCVCNEFRNKQKKEESEAGQE